MSSCIRTDVGYGLVLLGREGAEVASQKQFAHCLCCRSIQHMAHLAQQVNALDSTLEQGVTLHAGIGSMTLWVCLAVCCILYRCVR